jgi:hypothetical protein
VVNHTLAVKYSYVAVITQYSSMRVPVELSVSVRNADDSRQPELVSANMSLTASTP